MPKKDVTGAGAVALFVVAGLMIIVLIVLVFLGLCELGKFVEAKWGIGAVIMSSVFFAGALSGGGKR